jgi:hypothetical protein
MANSESANTAKMLFIGILICFKSFTTTQGHFIDPNGKCQSDLPTNGEQKFLHSAPENPMMASLPENPSAFGTAVKCGMSFSYSNGNRRHIRTSVRLDLIQHTVANKTPGEGGTQTGQLQPVQYLNNLTLRIGIAQIQTTNHFLPHQEPSIPAEEDPFLETGHAGQFRIIPVVPIEGVETQEAQVSCQFAQMDVANELKHLLTAPAHRPQPGRRKGMHLKRSILLDDIPGRDFDAGGFNHSYLGMGHAKRLEQIFYRTASAGNGHADRWSPPPGNESGQLSMKGQLHFIHHIAGNLR